MRNANSFTEGVVRVANSAVSGLLAAPWLGDRLGRGMTVITYTGRRSGRVFQTPISYQRKGDEVTIGVQFPDAKNWWRNFTGDGGPITIRLGGAERTGHAVVRRDSPKLATVTVALDPS